MFKYTLGGDPPQSRSEQILMWQDSGPAQSRLEELLKMTIFTSPSMTARTPGRLMTILKAGC